MVAVLVVSIQAEILQHILVTLPGAAEVLGSVMTDPKILDIAAAAVLVGPASQVRHMVLVHSHKELV
jgi:hypothetical protein